MFRFGTLLSESFRVLRQDPFILAPYILFSLIANTTETMFPTPKSGIDLSFIIIRLITVGWIIELFFKSLSLTMATRVFQTQNCDIQDAIGHAAKRYKQLFFSTLPLFLPMLVLFFLMQNQANNSTTTNIIVAILMILAIPLILILEFIPVVVVTDEPKGIIATIQHTATFVKTQLRRVLMFTMLAISTMLMSIITILMFYKMPVLGTSLIPAIIQGTAYSFIYTMSCVFYLNLSNPKYAQPTIDVSA